MSSESFPVLKLCALVFKQLSKPISNVIKDRAKESLYFRQYVAMPPAHFYNWMSIKIRMSSLNLGKPKTVPQLNETMAIELGSTLLGEILLFAVPATVLVIEYLRQARNESKKEEELFIEKLELVNTVNDMAFYLERQNVQLKRIKEFLAVLDSRRWIFRKSENKDYIGDSQLHLNRLPLPRR